MPEETSKTTEGGAATLQQKDSGAAGKKTGTTGYQGKGFAPRTPKFEGKSDDLKGHIYDCSDVRQSDQYTKTTKKIAEFIGRTYTYGGDARLAVETLSLPTLVIPTDPPEGANRTETRIWEKTVDEHVKQRNYLTENMKTLCSLVLGQCTDIMRQRLEAHETFTTVSSNGDGLALLKLVKGVAFQFQSQKYLPHALHEALKRYYNCSQGKHANPQAYYEHFQNVIAVVTESGGSLAGHTGVEGTIISEGTIERDDMTDHQLLAVKEKATNRSTAMAFLLGCDRNRYSRLLEDLENDFLQGRNNYPSTVAEAYNLLTNWKQERSGWRPTTNDGVAFASVDDKAKSPRNNKAHITCHRCEKKGHYASECPDRHEGNKEVSAIGAKTGAMLLNACIASGEFDVPTIHFHFLNMSDFDAPKVNFQFLNAADGGVTCQIGQDGKVSKTWILLDNQSTVDVFCNGELLTDIQESTESMEIHCNASIAITNLIGDLDGYGPVWYHPSGIANILSLLRVKEHGYRVTYDSNGDNTFTVFKTDGNSRVFSESERGLYYLDTGANMHNTSAVMMRAQSWPVTSKR